MFSYLNNDTIAAIATPPGKSAIGIVRISGPDAISIVKSVFRGADIDKAKTHTIHLGHIINDDGDMIDEVLISIFRKPSSYTGENSIEISCHGSTYILNSVLNILVSKGARLAEPGEFTFRAFINGKMDLSQAEAVADIIDSENKTAHHIAFNYFRGGFTAKMKELREKLIELVSLFELEIDFGEEDVEFASNSQLLQVLNEIKSEVKNLSDSFSLGNVIKKGVSVVIAGKPNAGKSTLLNTLLNEDRAITSKIPGTTRDFIEDNIIINGISFRFADTAGLTHSTDEIESKGIAKTLEKIRMADLVIYLTDITETTSFELKDELNIQNITKPCLIAINKIDKVNSPEKEKLMDSFSSAFENIIFISSKYGYHIDDLKNRIISLLDLDKYTGDQTIVSNARHYNILNNILSSISDIEKGIQTNLSKDLLTTDIHNILNLIGEITGMAITSDEILNNIFGRFCIGK
ncbi:MAG: tRNA uridine-5-carboxymethylaminomethyl(34) synthesis GTPase MnmE [Bacteroidia bacterium]|nr:tRNA uridine-5-carboxymethylaminomethyl(34) synthesis GTPase MnmE [Bacteroidia bacterium]